MRARSATAFASNGTRLAKNPLIGNAPRRLGDTPRRLGDTPPQRRKSLMCDIAGYELIAGGLAIFAIGMGAYRAGDKALDEALSLLKKTSDHQAKIRAIRDEWKVAKMLSDATTNPPEQKP
jgi:hypothetical protein